MEVLNQSENLTELFKAMCLVQAGLPNAKRSSDGYNYRYADLTETYEVSRPLLAEHGLCVIQFPVDDTGLVTYLGHISGQFICWRMDMTPVDKKPQTIGSSITYMRRYAHNAVIGVASEDDDGSAASGRLFDMDNPKAMGWLTDQMAALKVDPQHKQSMAKAMQNRPASDFRKLAAQFRNKTNQGEQNGSKEEAH